MADKPVTDGVRVDPPEEIRANKLAALLLRGETKDLVDLFAMKQAGLDPLDGLGDAARKDGGVDAATLAWVVSGCSLDTSDLRLVEPVDATALEHFRTRLVERLRAAAHPG